MSHIIPPPPPLPCQCSLQDWQRYFETLRNWWSRHLTLEFNWDAVKLQAQRAITAAFKQVPREWQPAITQMLKGL